VQNVHHEVCRDFSIGDDIDIVFGIKSNSNFINKKIKLAVELRSSDGIPICNMVDTDSGFQVKHLQDRDVVSIRIADIRLYPDKYFIGLWAGSLTSTETFDHVIDCLSFDIVNGGKLTTRHLPRQAGILFLTPIWEINEGERQVE
jgi:lipopolysaccharide transport system ATP-binding protein